MLYIGQFNEQQLRNGEDKTLVAQKKQETGMKYTKTCIVKKGKQMVGLKIWLLTNEEFYNSNEI